MPQNQSQADASNYYLNELGKGLSSFGVGAASTGTQALKTAIGTAIEGNPSFNPFDPNTWGSSANAVKQAFPNVVVDKLKKDSPGFAKVFSDPTALNQIQNSILTGNWGDAAATAVSGAAVPYIANALTGWVSKKVRKALGFIPPSVDSKITDPNLDGFNYEPARPVSMKKNKLNEGNEGHQGYMIVTLGGLEFEIPPAVQSVIPVGSHGGAHDTPGAAAGISFRHMQNYATMLIPGSSPVYQSLGIQGHMVEFVGVFLGFNRDTLLDSDKHAGNKTAQRSLGILSENFDPLNPDPLYTNLQKDKNIWANIVDSSTPPGFNRGGAWAISKAFQENVKNGMPQVLKINSGVIDIKYTVIVIGLDRIYQRDDRVYYKFQGLAVQGTEDDLARTKVVPAKKIYNKEKPAKGNNSTSKTNLTVVDPKLMQTLIENLGPITVKVPSVQEVLNPNTTISISSSTGILLATINDKIISDIKKYRKEPKSNLFSYKDNIVYDSFGKVFFKTTTNISTSQNDNLLRIQNIYLELDKTFKTIKEFKRKHKLDGANITQAQKQQNAELVKLEEKYKHIKDYLQGLLAELLGETIKRDKTRSLPKGETYAPSLY